MGDFIIGLSRANQELNYESTERVLRSKLREIVHVTAGFNVLELLEVLATALLLVDAPHVLRLHLPQLLLVQLHLTYETLNFNGTESIFRDFLPVAGRSAGGS